MDLRSQRMEDEWAIVCQMADANPECIRAKERLGDEFLLVMERTTAPVCRDQEIVLVQEHNKQLEKLVKQQRDLRMQQAQLAQQQDEQHQKFLFAKEAGVKFNGVLCGRATWKDGIPIFAERGGSAFDAWLKDEGVKNIENVNNALKAATPWYRIYDVPEPVLAGK